MGKAALTALEPRTTSLHDGKPMNEVASLFGQVDELRTTLRIEGQKEGSLTVLSFQGRDVISGLSAYNLTVGSSAETAAKLDDVLGREAVFLIERADDATSLHVMRGVVDEVFPGGVAVGKNLRQTHLRIVPRLAELGHGQQCRVFQNVTVVEIARQLFKLWHVEIDPQLHPEPLKREYCTQVNETDFAFLSRILADEGIHFHLEHGKDKSLVVLVNDPRGYAPIAGKETIAYRDAGGAVTVDHVKSIRRERRVRPGSVAYSDYNFVNPLRDMSVWELLEANDPGMLAAREIYEYPGHYNDPDAESADVGVDVQRPTASGTARARLRLEEQRSQALTFSGTSTSLRVRVGKRFEIADHADKAFNRTYLITHVQLGGSNGEGVSLEKGNRSSSSGAGIAIDFTAVAAETAIRPRVRPKPRAHLRTAKVVGPKADEPNVDEYGRIRIQFEWQRDGGHDDTSSCWVRMATPVANHNQGTYIAHRVGAEVLVDFLDGDVDRPVVISALFNGDNKTPQKLPSDATRAVLYRGLSVPGNKGKNEISCEDRAGKEKIFLHAQKDLEEHVLHNHSETIGANQTSTIGANQTTTIGANRTTAIGANDTTTIGAFQKVIVTKDHELHAKSVLIKALTDAVDVNGMLYVGLASGSNSVTVAHDGNIDINADKLISLIADAQIKLGVTANCEIQALPTQITLIVGDASISLFQNGQVGIVGTKTVKITGKGNTILVDSSGVSIDAGANPVSIKGSTIKLNS